MPGHQLAGGVQPALELVPPGRAVEALADIVLPGPEELDRRAGLPGDPGGLDHVLIRQAPAESPAAPDQMNRDVLGPDTQGLGHQLPAGLGVLGRCPDLHAAFAIMRRAVLRLEGSMGQVGIVVGRLDPLGGTLQGGVDVAIMPLDPVHAPLGGRGHPGLQVAAGQARLAGCRPSDVQAVPPLAGLPPGVCDDGHSGGQGLRPPSAFHPEGLAHTLHGPGGVEVGRLHTRSEHRCFLEGGEQHAGHDDIDTEQGLAGDNGRRVHLGHGLADDPEVLRVLELEAARIGGRQGRRGRGKGSVTCGPTRRRMHHPPGLGRAGRGIDAPGLGGCGDQQGPPRSADPPQLIPVQGGRHGPASELATIKAGIGVRLDGAHLRPVRIQLLGDQHGHRGLHPLADLGVLADHLDPAIRLDRDVGVQTRGRGRRLALSHQAEAQHEATAAAGGQLDHFAARRAVSIGHGQASPVWPDACRTAARIRM